MNFNTLVSVSDSGGLGLSLQGKNKTMEEIEGEIAELRSQASKI